MTLDLQYPSVSIITISQYNRLDFFKVLTKCIQLQDYPNIKEWIIVDSSHQKQNESDLKLHIEKIKNYPKIPPINYFITNKKHISGWRNDSHTLVTGDIVVCMDDDDYYPPTRISHAVEKLIDKKYLIAGCDKLYFYDIHFDKLFQFNGFGENHSTNNCFAYWKQFIDTHKYNEDDTFAEETFFTDNFTVPMIQLDAKKTVLQFSHNTNTFDKKIIIYHNIHLDPKSKYISIPDITTERFINNSEIYREYESIFQKIKTPVDVPYDIVYYLGICQIWQPQSRSLGGSEQAVKYLSQKWAEMGRKVAVYGNFSWQGKHQNVDYIPYYKFPFWNRFKNLIFWRLSGCFPFLDISIDAKRIIIDVHDNDDVMFQVFKNILSRPLHWMFKSDFHRQVFFEVNEYQGKESSRFQIIPNGIDVENFSIINKDVIRNPFRVCYCSYYTRGLYRILKNIWPLIFQLEPRAEFHIYYGLETVKDASLKKEFQELFSSVPGIMHHGRQPIEIINHEKHASTFHFYYTNTIVETDCISIKESLVAGCIPIISDTSVFIERDGIHIKWLEDTPENNLEIAKTVVALMYDIKIQQNLRFQYYQSRTIKSWLEIAQEWSLKCLLS